MAPVLNLVENIIFVNLADMVTFLTNVSSKGEKLYLIMQTKQKTMFMLNMDFMHTTSHKMKPQSMTQLLVPKSSCLDLFFWEGG